MTPELITLILNVVLISFWALGFLFGLRGIKKATSSLFSFIVTVVVVLILGPIVSKLVLNISISGTTINGHIINAVNDMIGEEMASSSAVQDVVKNVPLLAVNIVVAILLILVLGFVLKIIGSIIYRIFFGKDKVKEVEECQIVNGAPQIVKRTIKPKKHRLLGGLVGLVHGALLLFVLIFPLVGLVNIFSDISGMNDTSAEAEISSGSGFEILTMKELINENVPSFVFDYAGAANNSVLCKIGKVGGIGEMSLNIVSRCEINNETIRLGEEIRTIAKTYDTFVDFVKSSSSELTELTVENLFNDMVDNPNNYNFDKLYATVDNLFESKLVRALGNDVLKIVAQKVEESNTNPNFANIFTHAKKAVDNYANAGYSLKDDFTAMVGIFETSAKSGLIAEVKKPEIDIQSIKNILINEEDVVNQIPKNKVLTDLANKITSSNLLQKVALECANIGLEKLEAKINEDMLLPDYSPISLTYVDSSKEVRVSSGELKNICVYAFDILDALDEIDLESISSDFYVIFDSDVEELIKLVGKEIQAVFDMYVLRSTGVLDGLSNAMSKTEYSKYVDFVELKNSSNVSTQFNILAGSVKELVNSGVISTLRAMDDENHDQSIDEIVDKLATKLDNKTYANRIVSPLLNCTIFKNLFEYGLDEANVIVSDGMKLLDENAEIDKFNTSQLMTERENQEILSILDNLVIYLKDLNFANLKEADTMKDEIINSDLTLLGNVLDSMASATLFSATSTGNGVYGDMINVLKSSSFAEVFYFEAAEEDGFVWNSQMQRVKTLINSLNEITIDGENFVTYLMNGGDYSVILDNITSADVQKLKPLFEISIIRPIGVKVVNEINNKFKDFVGETLGANIMEFARSTDLTSQAQQITNIIASALYLDFSETDIDSINKDVINSILDSLSANANSNGVFKESYNAFLLKTTKMINESIKSVVGNSVGKNIITNIALQDILDEEQTIRNLINSVIGLSGDFASIDLKELNASKLNAFVDSFNVSTTKAKALLGATHNALLVYTVNTINKTIYDSVGAVNFTDYVEYDGDTNMTNKKGTIADILESACVVYGSLGEGEGLESVNNTDELQDLYDALESTQYTSSAKTAIENYIASTFAP